jgi:F-type H+-transporting ATPase subunit beta
MPDFRLRLRGATGGRLEVLIPNSLAESPQTSGTVVSVRGAVVDVRFDSGALPEINTALNVKWDQQETLVLEVHSHVDPATVRGIALQATAGLARGIQVEATGKPVDVPVGDAVLGRLLDVIGVVRDRGPALPPDTPRRSIHAPPPALKNEMSGNVIHETGIKVIDLLAPLAQGGKAARRLCSAARASARPFWSWK